MYLDPTTTANVTAGRITPVAVIRDDAIGTKTYFKAKDVNPVQGPTRMSA